MDSFGWSEATSSGVEWILDNTSDPVGILTPDLVDDTKVTFTCDQELEGDNGLYTVQDELGSGGFGQVYRVLQVGTNREFALKTARGTKGIKFLQKEYNLLKLLNGVDGFLRVHDQIMLGSNVEAIVLDLQGKDLKKTKNERGGLGSKRTAKVAVAMLTCLKALHDEGYVHQDIKPDNILIGNKDPTEFYLIDLGLAREIYDNPDNMKPCGTKRYMSLNQHMENKTSRQDDMEQLAYTLIDVAKGSLPWENELDHNSLFEAKLEIEGGDICGPNLHKIYEDFLIYTHELEYTDEPDYDKWISKFQCINEEDLSSERKGD